MIQEKSLRKEIDQDSGHESNSHSGAVTVSEAQRSFLIDRLNAIEGPTCRQDRRRFWEEAAEIINLGLSPEQCDAIRSVLNPKGPCAVVITGLPTEDVSRIHPTHGIRPRSLSYLSDALLFGVSSVVGAPIAYPDERHGEAIHEIANVDARDALRHNKSQRLAEPVPHTDLTRFPEPLRPTALLLLGMRNPANLPTVYSPVAGVLETLPLRSQAMLFQHRFDFGSSDGSFQGMQRPILRRFEGEVEVTLPSKGPQDDPEAYRTLMEFRAACKRNGSPVVVREGTMLVLSNRRCVHICARNESALRWVRKMHITSHFKELVHLRRIGPKTFLAHN